MTTQIKGKMNSNTNSAVGFAEESPAVFLNVPRAIKPVIKPTTKVVPWRVYTKMEGVSTDSYVERGRGERYPEGDGSSIFYYLKSNESVHQQSPIRRTNQSQMNRRKVLYHSHRPISTPLRLVGDSGDLQGKRSNS